MRLVVLFAAWAAGCGQPQERLASPGASAEKGAPLGITPDVAAAYGTTVQYSITGLRAGETAYLATSTAGEGAGPCLAKLGGRCLGILSPVMAGSGVADAAGVAVVPATVPASGPDQAPWSVQAMVKRGAGGATSKISAPLTVLLTSPFVSGLAARPANPTCLAPADRPVATGLADVELAFPNLAFTNPTKLLQAPGPNGRWYVLEQSGIVRVFEDDDAVLTSSVFMDLSGIVYDGADEMGLLGMAFSPDFDSTGEFYLNYTIRNAGKYSEVVRYTSIDGGLTADPATAESIMTVAQPYVNHNGGDMAFGPDGYLYLGFGDGGSGGDPLGNGQNVDVLLGKMLRIDPEGGVPYAIPPDNPFAAGGGAPEIYAFGLRNPWRWSFDRLTGDLWVGDVGQYLHEEVDKVERGGNYGWNTTEGFSCFADPACASVGGLKDPIIDYPHVGAAAVIGGFVYRGAAIPSLQGTYLFADYYIPKVEGIFYDADGSAYQADVVAAGLPGKLSTFAQGNDGEIYVAAYWTGQIWRLVPPVAPPPVDPFPHTLSATGCVDPANPAAPVAGMIPFEPNASFWSDGADKERFVAIPDGTTIAVGADGDWDLPIGSVVLKNFRVNGTLVETRLMMRHADGAWAGYPYAWRADGTDADLALGGTVSDVAGTPWRIPSTAECLQCHTDVAGSTLGLTTAQLNRQLTYASTGITGNELTTLETIGMFNAPLGATPDQLAALPDPYGADTVENRARAWLDVNCSQCHQPGGPGLGPADFRYTTLPHDLGVCDVAPTEGDAGVPLSLLVDPGNAANSVVSLRVHATDVWMMPPLGRTTVDAAGAAAVDAWIDALVGCP